MESTEHEFNNFGSFESAGNIYNDSTLEAKQYKIENQKVPKINSFALVGEQNSLKGKSVYEYQNKQYQHNKVSSFLGTEYESTISKYSSNLMKNNCNITELIKTPIGEILKQRRMRPIVSNSSK